jgi:hypothetical protein
LKVAVLPVLLAVAGAGIAHATATDPSGDTLTATSTVSKGGTPKKPKNVSGKYVFDVNGPTGQRANTATELDSSWVGLKENSTKFPVCTAAMIDAAQSDSVCPKGSAIGQGSLVAILGAEADKTQQLTCTTNITFYNEGNHKFNVFGHLADDPSKCLGLTYLAPPVGTWKRSGNTLQGLLPIPENIRMPLPGITGYFQHTEVTFSSATVQSGKKQIAFLQSVGCGKAKKRAFTFTSIAPAYAQPLTDKASAGKC